LLLNSISSEKGVIPLAKHIRSELLPSFDEDDESSRENISVALPLLVVEHAIQSLMVRTNYGLDGPLGYKLPPIVCVWRWEVRDDYRDWLPKSAKEKAEARIAERVQVCIVFNPVLFFDISFRPRQIFAQSLKVYRRMSGMPSLTRKVSTSSPLKT
jgi:hypothetical protein